MEYDASLRIQNLPADVEIDGVAMSVYNGRKIIGISDGQGKEITIRNVKDLESGDAEAILKGTPRFVRLSKLIAKIFSVLSSLSILLNI